MGLVSGGGGHCGGFLRLVWCLCLCVRCPRGTGGFRDLSSKSNAVIVLDVVTKPLPMLKLVSTGCALGETPDSMNCRVKLDFLRLVLRMFQSNMLLHAGAAIEVNPTNWTRKTQILGSSSGWAFDRYDRPESGHGMLELLNGNVPRHYVLRLGPTKFQQFLVPAGCTFEKVFSEFSTAELLSDGFVGHMSQVRRLARQGT